MGEHATKSGEEGEAGRQNIILVSIDSLRADHCGHLGAEFEITPTLDELASDGVAFENAVAPGPQTFSSMPVAFTGQHRPAEQYDSPENSSDWEERLGAIDRHLARHATIPEQLKRLGYSTGGISPNPWTSSASGFDRGFDEFVDRSGSQKSALLDKLTAKMPGVDHDSRRTRLALNLLTSRSFFNQWESFYNELDAMRKRLSEPYFLWVFLLDTHYPFLASRAHRKEQSLIGMYRSNYRSEKAMRGNLTSMPAGVCKELQVSYRDTIRAVDTFLDRLRRDVGQDDPAIIIHADHGESFGDHGNFGHHHRELYEENIHIPLVVANAGRSTTVTEPTSLISLPELTLDIAADGRVYPDSITQSTVLSSDVSGDCQAVRGQRFKYIREDGRGRLYDLRNDPSEQTDVTAKHEQLTEIFEKRLRKHGHHLSEARQLYDAAKVAANGGQSGL